MKSCLYEGRIRHRRNSPRPHAFSKRLLMVYLNLDTLDSDLNKHFLLRRGRIGWAAFDRADHLGEPSQSLDACVRELVEERIGKRPGGPIGLLTNPRHFGLAFNPVSFFFCFDSTGDSLEALVAEVHNTPWGERHCYVIEPDGSAGAIHSHLPKAFHVSPFMPMEQSYEWSVRGPGDRLSLAITSREEGEGEPRTIFTARLAMRRVPLERASAWLRYPGMTLQILVGIYWNALRLFVKRIPFHPHPERRDRSLEELQ